jgi:hypothetical protein
LLLSSSSHHLMRIILLLLQQVWAGYCNTLGEQKTVSCVVNRISKIRSRECFVTSSLLRSSIVSIIMYSAKVTMLDLIRFLRVTL